MYLDIFVSVILGFFTLRGLLTGFIFEVFSFAGLFSAAILTKKYVGVFYENLVSFLKIEGVDRGVESNFYIFIFSYLITFLGFYIVFYFIASVIQKILKSVSLGWFDRLMGSILGFTKGGIISSLIVAILIFLSPYNEAVNEIVEGSTSQKLVVKMSVLITFLPDSIKNRLKKLNNINKVNFDSFISEEDDNVTSDNDKSEESKVDEEQK